MPGTFGIVELDRYRGFRAKKLGNSTFWNMAVPMNLPGSDGLLQMLYLDFQLKEIDCPETAALEYGEVTVNAGYTLYISKRYALWQVPSDAFQTTDRMYTNNGSLRYTATNS